jgi:2'-5' RNA ligase
MARAFRLFIGIMVPEEVRTAVADIQSSVARLPMRVKLVEPENLHISLSFLGNVAEENIPNIASSLDKICQEHRPFTVRIGGMMLIPNERHLRVIALDVKSNGDLLEKLRWEVEKKVGGDSKPCHLTLSRVREMKDRRLAISRLKDLNIEKYFEVQSVCLVRSMGTRSGRFYLVVHESRLGQSVRPEEAGKI